MKLRAWADKQGITYMTAWRWFRNGAMPVPAYRTKTGMILVNEEAPSGRPDTACVYARVSSYAKKDDLSRQAERCLAFCAAKGWTVDKVVKEVASGMNDSRPKLLKLMASKPARIVVEHKDRLTRFGFRYLDELLPRTGCEVVVMNRDQEDQSDLMKDMIAIVTSFCCRLYGIRRGKTAAKKIKDAVT